MQRLQSKGSELAKRGLRARPDWPPPRASFYMVMASTALMLSSCGQSVPAQAPQESSSGPEVLSVTEESSSDGFWGGSTSSDIRILSSKPEYVSGDSVLVSVKPSVKTVTLNGNDVTSVFAVDPNDTDRLIGLVTGVTEGANWIVATTRWQSTKIKLTGYPITGPIISGPFQTPYICQSSIFTLADGSTLGPALDANCTVAPVVTYMYLQTTGTTLVPMTDTTKLPADVASTTTLSGVTVPFIVRVETSTVDRGIYETAVLHDPTTEQAPSASTPPKAWNRRLIAIEGYGCPGGWYIQGPIDGSLAFNGMDFTLLSTTRLGEGYATFANTLQHASNNCNAVLASEAAMMGKEQFIKTHGVPNFTVSAGCSGGSYGSAMPADRIPGLFDGVLIACTFPDPLGIAFSGSDGHLLSHYWAVTNPTGFTADQQVAVTGYKSLPAFYDAANQSGRTDPVPGRVDIPGYASAVWSPSVPVSLQYNPVTNPTGARPTVYDASKNMYGVDPATGFALRPFDNVGVQYGLEALNAGTITTSQFLDLNEKVGGYDQDFNYVATRSVGNHGAMKRAQEAGLQLGANGGLSEIPIFDMTGLYDDDGGYHYQWFHFSFRERLIEANGNARNHVMWRGNPVPFETAWSSFIDWVVAYTGDPSSRSQRERVIHNRPATLVDGCWSDATTFIPERQTLSSAPDSQCNALFPSWTFPRRVAGGPVAANIMKCTLKPISKSDYQVKFTALERKHLAAIFPTGVCDWSERGNHRGVVPNGSFGPSPVNLVFDISK